MSTAPVSSEIRPDSSRDLATANHSSASTTAPFAPDPALSKPSLGLGAQGVRPATTSGGTAIVYCESQFGAIDGKTANGLVRHSEMYRILSVIDSSKAGLDSGMLLDRKANGIPVCSNLVDALAHTDNVPDYFIFGVAPATGRLAPLQREAIFEAMARGMHIVSGLHEFLGDDPEFAAASRRHAVRLIDIRKPRPKSELRLFTGRIHDIACPRIAVLGTDCANGKRTTATVLNQALKGAGLNSVVINTGQTGLIQGARHGVAMDAVPSQFCAGELEATILEAYAAERPDVMIIEGQGALSHPAFSTSSFILRGSCPHAVLLQHAPGRATRCDFPHMPMPSPASEINMIETFADTRVIGLTINSENLSRAEAEAAMTEYARELGLPVTDALAHSPRELLDMVFAALPELQRRPASLPQ